jgi:hypothetical protein
MIIDKIYLLNMFNSLEITEKRRAALVYVLYIVLQSDKTRVETGYVTHSIKK